MGITTLAGTEIRDEDRSIVQVEISEEGTYVDVVWEFHCDGCDAMSSGLSMEEAEFEMRTHVCPDLPPCAHDPEPF